MLTLLGHPSRNTIFTFRMSLNRDAYTGRAGQTRKARVRVFSSAGPPQDIEVYRAINVAEHPELREPALEGTLHCLPDGSPLDLPFVYHDPGSAQFVLVIPVNSPKRGSAERARLLRSLDTQHCEEVPEYVRDFHVVYGASGLAAHLAAVGGASGDDWVEVDEDELEAVNGIGAHVPPAAFCERPTSDLGSLVDDDGLWLFGSLSTQEALAFEPSRSDLLIQLKWIEQTPVVVLALVDSQTAIVRRTYLSPALSDDRRLLLGLARDFRATIVLYDETRTLRHAVRLERPRAANASLILQCTEKAARPSAQKWLRCLSICRRTPPPLHVRLPPFVPTAPAADAAEALRRIDELERWSTPARIDFALLVASVPRTLLELAYHRVLSDGFRFGLAMSSELLLRAVSTGFSPSVRELVGELQRRFGHTERDRSCSLDAAEVCPESSDAQRARPIALCFDRRWRFV